MTTVEGKSRVQAESFYCACLADGQGSWQASATCPDGFAPDGGYNAPACRVREPDTNQFIMGYLGTPYMKTGRSDSCYYSQQLWGNERTMVWPITGFGKNTMERLCVKGVQSSRAHVCA